jgi:hypothetical protein
MSALVRLGSGPGHRARNYPASLLRLKALVLQGKIERPACSCCRAD